jgi:hypothetical protein
MFIVWWRVGISPKEFVGVVRVVDLGWACAVAPAQPPAFGHLGATLATGHHPVVTAASEEQLVRIGPAAAGPTGRVVNLAAVTGLKAVGVGAAAITRMADQHLVGGGDPLLSPEIQRTLQVVVEHRQVVDSVGGHAD